MKKTGLLLLIFCFFMMGIIAGKPTRETASGELEERLDDFEKEITTPNNNYTSIYDNKVDPNLSNSLAKRGENLINGFFDLTFKVIKGILD
ncbi:MAG: hypothetical protein PHI81_07575 [Synergistaceae bacterium]|nr:hypothetical protein [Synergistaceae bacterium]MDD4076511.1 hypothetical protein [Bacilli bacterium]MDD4387732.1 hypothetical protein [Bacilli bacterium]